MSEEKTSEEKYVDYVIEFIDDFKSKVQLLNKQGTEILPCYLNKAIAEYGSYSATLVAEYARLRGYIKTVKRGFDEWYSKAFMDTRNRLRNEATSSKTIAVKEIEMAVKTYNSEKYYEYMDAIDDAELKLDYIENLIKFYKRLDSLLVSLSYNMRSELSALSTQNKANGITEQERSEVISKRKSRTLKN